MINDRTFPPQIGQITIKNVNVFKCFLRFTNFEIHDMFVIFVSSIYELSNVMNEYILHQFSSDFARLFFVIGARVQFDTRLVCSTCLMVFSYQRLSWHINDGYICKQQYDYPSRLLYKPFLLNAFNFTILHCFDRMSQHFRTMILVVF